MSKNNSFREKLNIITMVYKRMGRKKAIVIVQHTEFDKGFKLFLTICIHAHLQFEGGVLASPIDYFSR